MLEMVAKQKRKKHFSVVPVAVCICYQITTRYSINRVKSGKMLEIPLGIENRSTLTYHASGGMHNEWLPFTKVKGYTNAFIVKDEKILLGYKKRGFGKGKYNGFGGKIESGETSLQAALRELEEESGVVAPLEYAGSLFFVSEGVEAAFQIDIYRAESYEGTITETDEMRPEWFSVSSSKKYEGEQTPEIPFSEMWETDPVWLPLLISKRRFAGRADFTKDGESFKLHRWWFGVDSASS